jgi:hypothetical protein
MHIQMLKEDLKMNTLERMMAKPIPNRAEYWRNEYRPTRQKIALTYNLLNKTFFKDKLERPTIQVYRQRECWGWANLLDNYRVDMGLNHRYPCEQFFIGVLAHEMIHQWQWEVDAPWRRKNGIRIQTCHGENFIAWKDTFAEYEIPFGMHLPHYYK